MQVSETAVDVSNFVAKHKTDLNDGRFKSMVERLSFCQCSHVRTDETEFNSRHLLIFSLK